MTVSVNIEEAHALLREYKAALPRCLCGSLLKEELTKLNLRMYDLGLTFPEGSALEVKFEDVIQATAERKYQSGIFVPIEEAENLRRRIGFLSTLTDAATLEALTRTRVKSPPLI